MPEAVENILSALQGLLTEQNGLLSQMEYVQEVIHDPLARSCNASFHIGRTVESIPPSFGSSRKASSSVVPVNLSFALYWDLFANFSALFEAYRQLHRLQESLCRALRSYSRDKNVLHHSTGVIDSALDNSIGPSGPYKRPLIRSASVGGICNTSAKQENESNAAFSHITHQRVQSLSCIPLSAKESASPKKKKFLNLSIHHRQKSISTRTSSSPALKKVPPLHEAQKGKVENVPIGINNDPHTRSSSSSPIKHLHNGVVQPNANPADLVVAFFTSNEMKEFMLQHLIYMDHFARHITHRVVDMRRIWNRVYLSLPSTPLQKLETTINCLTNEEKILLRNYEGCFNFLFSVLGVNGHPTDPRVSRSHFPEGSRYANKPHMNAMSPSEWEGFEVLLVLLATPAPILCRYLFRARCIIESKVLEASSPDAARRLKDGFIDLATRRISETYSVVVESIARRDVEMMVALFDRSMMATASKSKTSGFLGLYFSGTSSSADSSIDGFINMVQKLEEKSWISATLGNTIISNIKKNGSSKSGVSLPFFELWKGLYSSTGRNLLYCGQLHVSQNFKRMKILPRLVFLFSDSIVCAEEIPSNGLLRMQSFLLLQDASVRSLHNHQNLTADEIECARKLDAYPNAFIVNSSFGGKLFLITDTSEERHYWVKTVQRAIRHQPRLSVLREESKNSGEPVAQVVIHGKGLPVSSRLARQRRDDSGLQFEFQQQQCPVAEVGALGRGHASAVMTNGSVTSTNLSRFNSFSAAPGLPPPRGSYVKRELSQTNWAVLGSVHGRMGSLSLRRPPSYRPEDALVSISSESRLPPGDVPPVPRKPTMQAEKMASPSQSSLVRFNSFRCTGLDRTIASHPPDSGNGPVNSPKDENEESDHPTSESTSSRSTSLFGALETVLDFPRPAANVLDQAAKNDVKEYQGDSDQPVKEGSPSASHPLWIRPSIFPSSSSDSLSSEFSFSSRREDKQMDGGFFGVPMSAFQRSKRRDPNSTFDR